MGKGTLTSVDAINALSGPVSPPDLGVILLGSIGSIGSTGIYWHLLGSTGIYWDLLGPIVIY